MYSDCVYCILCSTNTILLLSTGRQFIHYDMGYITLPAGKTTDLHKNIVAFYSEATIQILYLGQCMYLRIQGAETEVQRVLSLI